MHKSGDSNFILPWGTGTHGGDPTEISELKAAEENEWDEYVRASGHSAFFHQLGWKRVLSETYHHRPLYLVARNDDRISGVFPLMKIRYPLIGDVLVSLPYAPSGGICAGDDLTTTALVTHLKEYIRKNNVRSLDVRSTDPLSGAGTADTSYHSMVLPLQENPDLQWSRLRKSMRRYVKKAQSSGTQSHLDIRNTRNFYGIYSRTMREFGTPAHSSRFFTALVREFPKNTRIAEITWKEECIAAIFLLEFNGTVIYGWGGSDDRYSHLFPNYSLFWDVIRDSCSRQLRSFDFGRSMTGEGTYLFKTGWGAEPRQLYYYSYPKKSVNTKKTSPKRKLFAAIWSHIPQSVTRGLGPVLRTYLP